jgi:uncharacterized protein YceK
MKRMSLILMLVTLSSSGCGTVCNLAGGVMHPDNEPRIYGGVIRDVEIIDKVVNKPKANPDNQQVSQAISGGWEKAAVLAAFVAVIISADPVLSMVADTLTLPITIPLQIRRIAQQEDKSRDSQPPVANSLQPP